MATPGIGPRGAGNTWQNTPDIPFTIFYGVSEGSSDEPEYFLITHINHVIKIEIKGSVHIRMKDLNKLNGQLFINYRQVNQSTKWKRNKINYLKSSLTLTKFNTLSKQQYPIQYYFELIENKYSYFCPGINRNLSNQPYYIYDNK